MAQLALAATLLWHDPLAMQDVPCSYGRLSLPCTTWCFHLHNGLKITSDGLKREHYLPGKGKKKTSYVSGKKCAWPGCSYVPSPPSASHDQTACKRNTKLQSKAQKTINASQRQKLEYLWYSTQTVLINRNRPYHQKSQTPTAKTRTVLLEALQAILAPRLGQEVWLQRKWK